jgi:hypothetical protein
VPGPTRTLTLGASAQRTYLRAYNRSAVRASAVVKQPLAERWTATAGAAVGLRVAAAGEAVGQGEAVALAQGGAQQLSREAVQARVAAARPESASAGDASAKAAAVTVNPAEQRRLDAQRRQQLAGKLRPYKKELAELDQRMAALQAEGAALEEKLMVALPPAELAEAGRRLKAIGEETAAAEERWLELSELIESIEAATP